MSKEVGDFRELIQGFMADTGNSVRNQIKMGRYRLSVQAGPYNYCIPKEQLDDVYQHEAFEVAILRGTGVNFVTSTSPCKVGKLLASIPEFQENGDEVFGYVRPEVIQDLYEKMIDILK